METRDEYRENLDMGESYEIDEVVHTSFEEEQMGPVDGLESLFAAASLGRNKKGKKKRK